MPEVVHESGDNNEQAACGHTANNISINNTKINFTVPSFIIKFKRNDTSSTPEELIIDIDVPLLKSIADCSLKINEQRLYLATGSYKLDISLPFPVDEKFTIENACNFDENQKKLIIQLPIAATTIAENVAIEESKKMKTKMDYMREDSGVEIDDSSPTPSISSSFDENTKILSTLPLNHYKNFLNKDIHYNFPTTFDCNTLDDSLAFTLHIKHADPDSLEYIKDDKFVHLKFQSLDSSGKYSNYYSFYFTFCSENYDHALIITADAEAWDNNVILTLSIENYKNMKSYLAGLNVQQLKKYNILEEFSSNNSKFTNLVKIKNDFDFKYKTLLTNNEFEIELSRHFNKNHDNIVDEHVMDNNKNNDVVTDAVIGEHKENINQKNVPMSKKQKRRMRKRRSLSESCLESIASEINGMSISNCDKIEARNRASDTADDDDGISGDCLKINKKYRSMSESRSDNEPSLKGILKHTSRYGRSTSESCSSIDETSYSCSIDFMIADSFNQIPEEHQSSGESNGLSESCRKTVRFSDVIQRQLFRLHSSILGQRKKNQKKKVKKQRAIQRRNSEGDSADCAESPNSSSSLRYKKTSKKYPNQQQQQQQESQQNTKKSFNNSENSDSVNRKQSQQQWKSAVYDSEISDCESKNSLIFEFEM